MTILKRAVIAGLTRNLLDNLPYFNEGIAGQARNDEYATCHQQVVSER
jgi:hypothetical protein